MLSVSPLHRRWVGWSCNWNKLPFTGTLSVFVCCIVSFSCWFPNIYMFVYVYCMFIYICVYVRVYIYMHIYGRICGWIYIYIYIYSEQQESFSLTLIGEPIQRQFWQWVWLMRDVTSLKRHFSLDGPIARMVLAMYELISHIMVVDVQSKDFMFGKLYISI